MAELQKLGVRPQLHGAQPLTRELCERSAVIYCMTEEQRQAVIAIAPAAIARRTLATAWLGEPALSYTTIFSR